MLNPYQAPKAELFWMSPQERQQSRLSLSARRWAVVAAILGTLQVAYTFRPGLLFLVVHGALAALSLAGAAGIGSAHFCNHLLAPWPRWLIWRLAEAGGLLSAGLLGAGGAAGILAWLGHPAPLGPLGGLASTSLDQLLAAGYALSLAGCAAWALAWRWKLAPRNRRPDTPSPVTACRVRGSAGGR